RQIVVDGAPRLAALVHHVLDHRTVAKELEYGLLLWRILSRLRSRGGRARRRRGLVVLRQVPPGAVIADYCQELLAKVAKLGIAATVNQPHLFESRWPHAGQLTQRRITEDGIRWPAALLGLLPAQIAESLEQLAIDPFPGCGVGTRLLW